MRGAKILFVNDYPMDKAYVQWQAGKYPGHHLWGMNEVQSLGKEVIFSPWIEENKRTNFLSRFRLSPKKLFQLKLILSKRDVSNIYFGSYWAYKLAGRAEAWGFLRHKIVVLIHHPVPYSKSDRRLLNAAEGVFFLNNYAYNETVKNFPEIKSKSVIVGWCLDTAFYDQILADGNMEPKLIVAAGKTLRDYDTFIEGVRRVNDPDLRVEIYCSEDTAPKVTDPRVKVFVGTDNGASISYMDLVKKYKEAFAIAIPMKKVDKTIGLTSIWDAFAIGKPVLVTENPGIDAPIKEEDLGKMIAPDDVQGWADAIQDLLSNPLAAINMGKRGRDFGENQLSPVEYGKKLNRFFDRFY